MRERCFLPNDDFLSIIKQTLNSSDLSITQIKTGWTNTVFKVFFACKFYIFRFPRNDYWSTVLENECEFNKFITQNSKIRTPKLHLCYLGKKPYSWHEMIEGSTLAEVYGTLSTDDKKRIASQIAEFLVLFQDINLKDVPMDLETTSNFLERLSKIENSEYDIGRHGSLIVQEELNESVISHGDLNSSNVLIDKNKNVCAILDFAFISKSANGTDIGRIIGRLPEDFAGIMIDAYNKVSPRKVLTSDILEIAKVYNYVDSKYIEYIKREYPEIKI